MRQLPLGVELPDHATFATFHRGANGDVVALLEAALAGRVPAVSLFLSGPAASGKTHLLQAACGAAGERGVRCGYLSLGRIGADRVEAALQGWSDLALVCIDEVDVAAGRRPAEVALLQLYNQLAAAGGLLVLAATRPSGDLRWGLPDLASRLAAGLHASLVPPDDADAASALRLRAQARGLELPDETAAWLLRRFRRDLHSQCALLDGLEAASVAAQRRLTIPFVRSLLGQREEGGAGDGGRLTPAGGRATVADRGKDQSE